MVTSCGVTPKIPGRATFFKEVINSGDTDLKLMTIERTPTWVGDRVGAGVGGAVGALVGCVVGDEVGEDVGCWVGEAVGETVAEHLLAVGSEPSVKM